MKFELSGRPVAPQIRGFRTEAEFKRFMSEADSGALYVATEYMRTGKSKWIARAYQEGWGNVLKSLIYQLVRKDMLEYGSFPSNERLDQLVIDREDHDRFKRLGGNEAA